MLLKTDLFIEPFHFHETDLAGSFVIEPILREDSRGWFFRSFDQAAFARIGLQTEWLQVNHSYTRKKGTIRGLHFQYPPCSEIKLLRCIAGSVQDVIIDLRQDSATFLEWISVELSAFNRKMLYIPQGFAHGFQTLEDDCELVYQHSVNYQPSSEGGISYNDRKISIEWMLPITEISERDESHPHITNDFKGIKL